MSPNGEGEFLCNRAANGPPMKARISYNKNGGALAWRCYAYFEGTNNAEGCIANNGELTAVGCSDPIYATGKYCTRTEGIQDCDQSKYMCFHVIQMLTT